MTNWWPIIRCVIQKYVRPTSDLDDHGPKQIDEKIITIENNSRFAVFSSLRIKSEKNVISDSQSVRNVGKIEMSIQL